MDETRWQRCTYPMKMLRFLRGNSSARKLRLFACACCRGNWRLLRDERIRHAVEVSELVADQRASKQELGRARHLAHAAIPQVSFCWTASWAAYRTTERDAFKAAVEAVQHTGPDCRLVREIFGNPFRQTEVDPGWLDTHSGLARKLAEGVYLDSAFDRLPILADALEDAGCTDDTLLSHLRQPECHYLGCWALDLLLGRR